MDIQDIMYATLYLSAHVYLCVGFCAGNAFQVYYCFLFLLMLFLLVVVVVVVLLLLLLLLLLLVCTALGRRTCMETSFVNCYFLIILLTLPADSSLQHPRTSSPAPRLSSERCQGQRNTYLINKAKLSPRSVL